ncbi:hypothetical protein V1514DRAFT_322052 [Lipomyces japonicus]|uniref:uncharacterized protein n=1 Tax=Lipomyces japonicus TaxID=56871 RepID=UPI0034CE31D9
MDASGSYYDPEYFILQYENDHDDDHDDDATYETDNHANVNVPYQSLRHVLPPLQVCQREASIAGRSSSSSSSSSCCESSSIVGKNSVSFQTNLDVFNHTAINKQQDNDHDRLDPVPLWAIFQGQQSPGLRAVPKIHDLDTGLYLDEEDHEQSSYCLVNRDNQRLTETVLAPSDVKKNFFGNKLDLFAPEHDQPTKRFKLEFTQAFSTRPRTTSSSFADDEKENVHPQRDNNNNNTFPIRRRKIRLGRGPQFLSPNKLNGDGGGLKEKNFNLNTESSKKIDVCVDQCQDRVKNNHLTTTPRRLSGAWRTGIVERSAQKIIEQSRVITDDRKRRHERQHGLNQRVDSSFTIMKQWYYENYDLIIAIGCFSVGIGIFFVAVCSWIDDLNRDVIGLRTLIFEYASLSESYQNTLQTLVGLPISSIFSIFGLQNDNTNLHIFILIDLYVWGLIGAFIGIPLMGLSILGLIILSGVIILGILNIQYLVLSFVVEWTIKLTLKDLDRGWNVIGVIDGTDAKLYAGF